MFAEAAQTRNSLLHAAISGGLLMKKTSGTFLCTSLALFLLALAPATARAQLENSQAEIADHVGRATAATQRRDFQEAETEWRKVLAITPKSPQALNNLSMV